MYQLFVDFSTSRNDEKEICQCIKKIVDKGALVVCTEVKLWNWNDIRFDMQESIDCQCIPMEVRTDYFCRTPQGWMKKNDLSEMLVLKRKVD